MILVDTNIIIDFWKRPTESISYIFDNEVIYICGVVKAELLLGAKDDLSFNKIKKAIKCFPEIPISSSFWDDLSFNFYKLKINGITVPFQDAMIATIAISNNLKLWTLDKHFTSIQKTLNQLKFFNIDIY